MDSEASGDWIQATFDLVEGGATAPYVGYFIALCDFNDRRGLTGGNILLDGAAAGQAGIYVDYPGGDTAGKGKIGKSGYAPGRNYGVRVTNIGNGKFELAQLVDGVPEDGTLTLTSVDLPDGAFGFEYCCGRSYVVDNVLIEASISSDQLEGEAKRLAEQYQQRRREHEASVKQLEASKPKPIGRLAAVSEPMGNPPVVRLLTRGDYKTLGEEVPAGAPVVLSESSNPSTFVNGTTSVRDHWSPSCFGAVDHAARFACRRRARKGDREPLVATSFRHGDRVHAGQSGLFRKPAKPSGVARLSGRRVRPKQTGVRRLSTG